DAASRAYVVRAPAACSLGGADAGLRGSEAKRKATIDSIVPVVFAGVPPRRRRLASLRCAGARGVLARGSRRGVARVGGEEEGDDRFNRARRLRRSAAAPTPPRELTLCGRPRRARSGEPTRGCGGRRRRGRRRSIQSCPSSSPECRRADAASRAYVVRAPAACSLGGADAGLRGSE